MVALRERVLQMAHQLAHLEDSKLEALERPDTHHTIGWSRGVEEFKSGVPDTGKGSFYYDPFVGDGGVDTTTAMNDNNVDDHNVFPNEEDLPELEAALQEMTHFMAKVGLWIVQLMDEHLKLPDNTNIYKSLETCEMAKARLLYYYPTPQILSCDASSSSASNNENYNGNDDNNDGISNDDDDDDRHWWCGWHKDHGSLTALLPGLLIGGDEEDKLKTTPTTSSITQPAGLYIDTLKHGRTHVSLPPTSLGFQLGETIQLLSRGKLRATPHAVRAPSIATSSNSDDKQNSNNVGRASLALFLQPPADQELPPISDDHQKDGDFVVADESLRARWRPTFGAFQRATTQAFQ